MGKLRSAATHKPFESRGLSTIAFLRDWRERCHRNEAHLQFGDHTISIWDLFTAFGYTKCMDYRDKVYALLPLEKGLGMPDKIPVDYRTAKAELSWTVIIKRFQDVEELLVVYMINLSKVLGLDGLSKPELLSAFASVRKRVPCLFNLETPFDEYCTWRAVAGFS